VNRAIWDSTHPGGHYTVILWLYIVLLSRVWDRQIEKQWKHMVVSVHNHSICSPCRYTDLGSNTIWNLSNTLQICISLSACARWAEFGSFWGLLHWFQLWHASLIKTQFWVFHRLQILFEPMSAMFRAAGDTKPQTISTGLTTNHNQRYALGGNLSLLLHDGVVLESSSHG
jgi:hypothetical protein